MSNHKKAHSLKAFFIDGATSDDRASVLLERIRTEKSTPKLTVKQAKEKRRAA